GQLEIAQDVTASAFAAARGRGALTVLNPAPAATLAPALLAATDWVVPNEVEAAALAPTLSALAALGPRVVVTLGERGASLLDSDGQIVEIAAEQVDAVDTTGAGDAFVGAFAYGLATHMSEEAAVRLGCACATASVLRRGTQSSFLGREEAAQLYEG